jgi:hypothetical protein
MAVAFGFGFLACMVLDAWDFTQRRVPWPERAIGWWCRQVGA